MNWKKLLCIDRIRDLANGRKTYKSSFDARSEIERDYGRVVFSAPVRRLQDKTQIFPLDPTDAVRTRLTHSLEVSSVAHDIAHVVTQHLVKRRKLSVEQAYQIETIARTCGLIHDLGNPPFGHSGEDAIKEWFVDRDEPHFWNFEDDVKNRPLKGDFINFDGNAQTVRLVSRLQVLGDLHGVNFTAATMSALLKYIAPSSAIDRNSHARSKLGYFQSEKAVVENVQRATGTTGSRNPITFLVEAADDICYCAVDLEDAIRKEVISWLDADDILRSELTKKDYERLVERGVKRIERVPDDILRHGTPRDEARSRYLRTLMIAFGANAVIDRFLEVYESIMKGDYDRELLYDSGAARAFSTLKNDTQASHRRGNDHITRW